MIGNDPSHGLPGVGLSRRLPFSDILVGDAHLRHKWDSTEDISRSKWIPRGWTLQESYLSPRRLFFTERQVIFACNTESLCEHTSIESKIGRLNGVLGPRTDEVHAKENAMKTLVETYSRRQIRRDDDALNAISGMLRSLTSPGRGYAHLWAVPLQMHSEGTAISLADCWATQKRGRRRKDFPNWSPLGWTGQIDFVSMSSLSAQTQIWTGLQLTKLEKMTLEQIEDLGNNLSFESRFPKYTASVFRLALSWTVPRVESLGRNQQQLCCTNMNNLVFVPFWGTAPEELNLAETVLCMNIRDGDFLLLLRPCHTYSYDMSVTNPQDLPVYERVGSIAMRSSSCVFRVEKDSKDMSSWMPDTVTGFWRLRSLSGSKVLYYQPPGHSHIRELHAPVGDIYPSVVHDDRKAFVAADKDH